VYRIVGETEAALPLVVHADDSSRVSDLVAWLADRGQWLQGKLERHGALLLRGFQVKDAQVFESVARAIAPELRTDYLGTPRTRLTDHVFPASDLPGPYPIAQHCEMSYLPTPPSRVFFCCLVAPAPDSGETPLADFRKVWRDLDPAVRDRFEHGGIRIIRNFRGPQRSGLAWKQERWDEFFGTTDRAAVEAKCGTERMEAEWTADGGLRVVIMQPVHRDHPHTGERVWYNQFAAHHLSSSAWEYPRIFRMRPTLRNWIFWQVVRASVALKRRCPTHMLAYYCTYADGSAIPDGDMKALLATIWKHKTMFAWQRGDVLAIDNYSVSHGRMPFKGRREIVACLA
jgi:alpha-ketoglutarate-dependent taurine dioxygenase